MAFSLDKLKKLYYFDKDKYNFSFFFDFTAENFNYIGVKYITKHLIQL